MNWLDILVIVLIAGYCAYILFGKKKQGCGGCSGCCAGCQSRACQQRKEGGAPVETENRQ